MGLGFEALYAAIRQPRRFRLPAALWPAGVSLDEVSDPYGLNAPLEDAAAPA
jgi:hypothetical protein